MSLGYDLSDVLRDTMFSGYLVRMNEEYTPISVKTGEPFNNRYALFDYSLMLAEQSNNIYVFKPHKTTLSSICSHRDEILNVLNNIKSTYIKPIEFSEEMGLEQFVSMYLLKIPVDELYDLILPSKYKPKNQELLKQIIIQATRRAVLSESKYSSIFFTGSEEFGFTYQNPSSSRETVWRFIIEEVLPSIKEMLGYSTINNLTKLYQEGYYGVYPEFRIEDDIIQVKIHTVKVSDPKDHKTYEVSITMNNVEKGYHFDQIFSEYYGYIAFTGNILNFFRVSKDKFIQVIYDLLKKKGKMITINDGVETVIENVHDVHMDTQKLYVDDMEISLLKSSVIKTSQYYLTKEKIIRTLFDDTTLEKAKKLFEDYLKKINIMYKYEHHIVNSELFGVMLV